MDDQHDPPFRVESDGDRHAVVRADGQEILALTNAHSAAHYVELLTRAYRFGYKAGWRAHKQQD